MKNRLRPIVSASNWWIEAQRIFGLQPYRSISHNAVQLSLVGISLTIFWSGTYLSCTLLQCFNPVVASSLKVTNNSDHRFFLSFVSTFLNFTQMTTSFLNVYVYRNRTRRFAELELAIEHQMHGIGIINNRLCSVLWAFTFWVVLLLHSAFVLRGFLLVQHIFSVHFITMLFYFVVPHIYKFIMVFGYVFELWQMKAKLEIIHGILLGMIDTEEEQKNVPYINVNY